mmetsp:Transcript_5005/g.11134  ORF Transcript_5005/g.11134 Transcript_5005/m.11134 type:complete len:212 (-) Transcript_5005:810-1445(-)
MLFSEAERVFIFVEFEGVFSFLDEWWQRLTGANDVVSAVVAANIVAVIVFVVIVASERPAGFHSVNVRGDPNLEFRFQACFRWRWCIVIVAKGCNAVELLAGRVLDKLGGRAGACVDPRFVGQGASLSPRNNSHVIVHERTLAVVAILVHSLDQWTSRVSLAGISFSLWISGTEHRIGNLPVVTFAFVAIAVGDHWNRHVVNKLRTACGLG